MNGTTAAFITPASLHERPINARKEGGANNIDSYNFKHEHYDDGEKKKNKE